MLEVHVLDDRHVRPPGSLHDVVLDLTNLGQLREVLVDRAHALGGAVPDPEVRRVHLAALDRQDALHDERPVDRRQHPGYEMHALEHHREALLERAVDRGLDADEHVARLVEEAQQVRISGLVVRDGRGSLEARVVDRRHELLREEGAHRLTDEVRRGHARDPEPVRDLGGDARLPGASGAADEHDDRPVELLELLEAEQLAHRLGAFFLAEHLDRELLEPVEVDHALVALGEVELEPARQHVRPLDRDAGRHERLRHQALRVGQPAFAAEREPFAEPSFGHGASSRTSSSRPSAITSLSASTTSTPRSAAASATTSIAAALISTRKTSASTRCSSSRSAGRLARLRDTCTTSASRWSVGAGPVVNTATRRPPSGSMGRSLSVAATTGTFLSSRMRPAAPSSPCMTTTRSDMSTR